MDDIFSPQVKTRNRERGRLASPVEYRSDDGLNASGLSAISRARTSYVTRSYVLVLILIHMFSVEFRMGW